MKLLPKVRWVPHNAGYQKGEEAGVTRKSTEELVKAWRLRYRLSSLGCAPLWGWGPREVRALGSPRALCLRKLTQSFGRSRVSLDC